MVREYIFDLAKVLEGALNGDVGKALAYAEQLASRLANNGEEEAAQRVREVMTGQGGRRAHLARSTAVQDVGTSSLPLVRSDGNRRRSDEQVPQARPGSVGEAPPLPRDTEFRLPMAEIHHYRLEEAQVALEPQAQGVVDQFVRVVESSSDLAARGVGVPASLLLCGPPGCGKTLTASHLAARLGLPLVTARVDAIVSSYLGSTAKNLRQLFDFALSFPCVLFLDELDAIGKMRDDAHELGELKRVVISLLQNIDALPPGQVLVAATNHPHLLDPALWRRFAYKVWLREPDAAQRRKMVESLLSDWADENIISLLATLTEGMSGASLKFLADECVRAAVLNKKSRVEIGSVRQAWSAASLALTPSSSWLHDQQAPHHHTFDLVDVVRRLRQADHKAWTQTRLSALFGISQTQISRLLSEARNISDSADPGPHGVEGEAKAGAPQPVESYEPGKPPKRLSKRS